MGPLAYTLNSIKTHIYSLFRETCFLDPSKLNSKQLNIVERPHKRTPVWTGLS